MMNNNAWLGCFPVDLCLLSCPSFVNLSLTMAAHIELYLFLSYLLYTLTPCHTLFFFFLILIIMYFLHTQIQESLQLDI